MDIANGVAGDKVGVGRHTGLLYPLMLIAAIAVIVFSVAGIATMMGWLPSVESKIEPAAKSTPASAAPASRVQAARPRANASAAVAACADCGVIESIRAVEAKSQGTGLGAIGGAVIGGILGNQVGRGGGRTAATVVGAGAGAYAGHEIEKNVSQSVSYRIRVRMSDGSIRTFHENTQPALGVGQKVRVTGESIVAAG